MPELKENDWLKISEDFYKRTNFPNCLGAVDGKHYRLEKPNGADVKIEFCDKIVKACCIVHNFVRKYDGIRFKDELYGCNLRNMDPTSARPTVNCIEKRDYFGNYFTSSSGSIPWQYDKI
ncbi:hypothetical protein ACJJTC_008719 [Scirpophaga incertulas]